MNKLDQLKIICNENNYNKLTNFYNYLKIQARENEISDLFDITISKKHKETFDFLFEFAKNNENLQEDILTYCVSNNVSNKDDLYFFEKVIDYIDNDVYKIQCLENAGMYGNSIILSEIINRIDKNKNKENLETALYFFISYNKKPAIEILINSLDDEYTINAINKTKAKPKIYYTKEMLSQINEALEFAENIRENKILLNTVNNEINNSLNKSKRKM